MTCSPRTSAASLEELALSYLRETATEVAK